MTAPTAQDLETILCAACERQSAQYREAFQFAERLRASLRNAENGEAPLSALLKCLETVARIDAETASIRERWHTSGAIPGERLRLALANVTEDLARLTKCVAEAQTVAEAQKSRLIPQLEALARSRSMRRAYGEVQRQSTS